MRVIVGKRVLWEPKKIRPWDWLLIIGLTLAPMTGLRVWKIGPGEVLCLLWGLKSLFSRRIIENDIARFFAFFIIALFAGSVVGYYVAPNELRITDLLTWIYLGVITVSIYKGLKEYDIDYNETLFYGFARVATIWYLFLFLFSRTVSRFFLGAPLLYSSARFSGGGTNPHQIAVLLCGLTCVFMSKVVKKKKIIINTIYMLISIYLMLQTGSSTGVMSVVLGVATMLYLWLSNKYPNHRVIISALLALASALLMIIGASYFWDLFMKWVASDPNGMGRFRIYSTFPRTFVKSPLIGLGPGIHGIDGYIEFHNTYLEVLAATGTIGGAILIIYSLSLFRKVLIGDWMLFPVVVSMYAYGLAGFAMRRLVYWGLIAFVTVISEQILFTNDHLDLYSERRNKQ